MVPELMKWYSLLTMAQHLLQKLLNQEKKLLVQETLTQWLMINSKFTFLEVKVMTIKNLMICGCMILKNKLGMKRAKMNLVSNLMLEVVILQADLETKFTFSVAFLSLLKNLTT